VFVPSAAETATPPDLARLTQQVNYAWTVFQNAHWSELGRTLPRLLTTAQTVVAAYSGADDQARRARSILSQAYQVTASTLFKLGEFDLGWLAVERGFVLAEETGDSLLIGYAARQIARGSCSRTITMNALPLSARPTSICTGLRFCSTSVTALVPSVSPVRSHRIVSVSYPRSGVPVTIST
jgi:hypothetical protein